jgi:FkbM family methyltransferase
MATLETPSRWSSLAPVYEAVSELDDVGEEYERVVRRVYEGVLAPGDVAIDVGAHHGRHALPMGLAVGPGGGVVAVEPIPWALGRLAERVEGAGLWGVVVPLHGCVGDECGVAEFSIVPGHPGWSARHVRTQAAETVPLAVPELTIDSIAGSFFDRVRFMKIDVEGGEPAVLAGARGVLGRDRPIVHVEIAAESLEPHGFDASDVYSPLVTAGYEIFDLLGTNICDPVLFLRSVTHRALFDYIAVHRDDPKREAVEAILARSFRAVPRLHVPRGRLPHNEEPQAGRDWQQTFRSRIYSESALESRAWPQPHTRAADELNTILVSRPGPAEIRFGPATAMTFDRRRPIYVPIDSGPLQLSDQSTLVVELQVRIGTSTTSHQTLFELRFTEGEKVAIVRVTPDLRLQLFWVVHGVASPTEHVDLESEQIDLKITVERRGETTRLRARIEGTDIHVSTGGDPGDAVSVAFSIGQRLAWNNPDAVGPSVALVRVELLTAKQI